MIKKTLLAASIGLFSASIANAAVVYEKENASLNIGGRLAANMNSVFAAKDYDKPDANHKVKLEGDARLNVDASSTIYDGIKAKAFGEWEVSAESGNNDHFATRYAIVGFDTDFMGSLVFGQTESAMYKPLSVTDVFIDWGFAGTTFGDLADGGRQEGQIVYSLDDLNGFSFGASYQTASLNVVSSGAAFNAGYKFNEEVFPIYFGVGYDTYDMDYVHNLDINPTNVASELADKLSRDSFGFGFSAGDVEDGFYLAGIYQYSKYAKHNGLYLKDTNSYEVVAGYAVSGFGFLAGYENRHQGNLTLVSDIALEAKYNFNDNFLAYTEAQFATGKTDDKIVDGEKYKVTGHDLFSVGLQYNF